MTELIGVVESLWRYPVKSMQGEELSEGYLTERGLLGDRVYAVQECSTGHIASAKHPRKWQALFACRAQFVIAPKLNEAPPPIMITLPNGEAILSSDPACDQRLSEAVGRAVRLVCEVAGPPTREANRAPVEQLDTQEAIRQETMGLAAPPGAFFDYAPVHIITNTTIAALQAGYPDGRFAMQRFRPNLLIAAAESAPPCVEQTWLGGALGIGAEAVLDAIDPSPRCVVTTLAQADLPQDLNILRTIAQQPPVASATLAPGVPLHAVAGIYARSRRDGWIQRGERVWHPVART